MAQHETQADRDIRALDDAQKRPCGLCGSEPRLAGDHLGKLCRYRLNASRTDYEQRLAAHLAEKKEKGC